MDKTILVSAYLSGSGQAKKVRYFERLDEYLRASGCKLFLLNTGPPPLVTACDHVDMPPEIAAFQRIPGSRFLSEDDLSPEVIRAAAVEAEIRNSPLVTAAVKVLLFRAFARQVIRAVRPGLCVVWHQFNGLHRGLVDLCEGYKIPVVYAEYGVLPGTVVFETGGQMAESWVARESEKFMRLPVDERDLEAAEKLLERVRAEKLSRKEQSDKNSIDPILKEARERGRKVIFYGGQNDFQTGMLPSFLPEAKIHSPVFVDTIDALQCLAFLAEKNNWHIIFKPHPMIVKWHKDATILTENRVTTVLDADIFECMEKCDLTATIVSQLSYMALIHGRPSVLLGRNQLSGKGCAYEVGSETDLEPTLRKALEEGITDPMRRNWMRHAAQLLRHYLYSFEEATRPIMGRDVDEVARYLLGRYELPELNNDGSRLGEDNGGGIFGSDCHSRFHLLKLRLACRALSVANSPGGMGHRKDVKRALARPRRGFMGRMYLKQVCGLK